ncbi:MAG TPA: hypothetical protein VLE22_12730 [Bryobacteraceae bacterium]|nr:hypothetical protein [Bryobacteraceae bacterium]
MIPLLNGNGKQTREKNLRANYLERLREIAEDTRYGGDALLRDAAVGELSEVSVLEQTHSEVALPEPWQVESEESKGSNEAFDSDEFRLLAEQVAPRCIDALTEAFRGVHRLAAGDLGKAEAVTNQVIALSDEIRHINGEISSLRQSTEFLTGAERDLVTRAAVLEGQLAECATSDRQVIADLAELTNAQARDRESQTLANSATQEQLNRLEQTLTERLSALENRFTASLETVSLVSENLTAIAQALQTHFETSARINVSLSGVQEAQEVLRRRLDNQAEVMRKLCASEQERGNQLQTTLQKMKEMTVEFFMPAPLPEDL